MDLVDFINDLKKEITRSLTNSSRAYYQAAIDLFHKYREQTLSEYQPAIGMLCIAVELLLKAVIAKKAFRHLYTNIPTEIQLLMGYPESLPKSINPRQFLHDIQGFKYKTVEFNEAVSLFYKFYPEKKQEFKPYFSLMSLSRNISIHGAFPSIQRYDLDRIAFISTKLFTFIEDQKIFKYFSIYSDEKTTKFIDNYQEKKIKRVQSAIESAKTKSKKIDYLASFILSSSNKWETMIEKCPVCGSDATFGGFTEEYQDGTISGLTFFCDYFFCHECGLELNDYEEIELAGMENFYDRSELLDDWRYESYHDDY